MYLLLPIILFIVFFVPYLYLIPGNDGNLEFSFAHNWYIGANRYQILSLHPPFKLLLFSLFFKIFGYGSIGYIGLVFGIIGIIALYFVAKKLFDKNVAFLSSILLATSGLFLSVGVFSIHDYLITVLILLAFLSFLHSKYIPYAIFASLAVLTKETAVFFAGSILLYDLIFKKHITFYTFLPLIALAWYIEFVHFSGYHVWNDWNFSSTAQDGSIYTMMYNLFTFHFLNQYAYENWLHLFVFNFNWVYWIFACISFFYISKLETKKELIPIGIFFFSFSLTVLAFQTYTINRYILPLLPFLYMLTSFGITKLPFKKVKISFTILIVIVSFVSLSQSVDPISNIIWSKTQILGQSIYLNKPLDGDDGVTYNMQYLQMMQTRTIMIKGGMCQFPEIANYDAQTLSLLNIHTCK